MSYTVTLTVTPDSDVPTLIQEKFDESCREPLEGMQTYEETKACIDAVCASVTTLVGSLGDNWALATIVVSGHANPGNKFVSGWSNDMIACSFYVLEYKPVELVEETSEPVGENDSETNMTLDFGNGQA